MKQLGFLLSLCLLFLVSPVQGEDTTTLHGRFATNENGAPNVWIGVFESPMRPSAEAWSWTQVESTEFTLTVPRCGGNSASCIAERFSAARATD